MSEEISEKERKIFNDLIVLILLIFTCFINYMLNTNGFRHGFEPTGVSLLCNAVLILGLSSFLAIKTLKKVIFWLSFILGIWFLFINGLVFSEATPIFVVLYILFFLYKQTKNTDYLIFSIWIFITFLFIKIGVFQSRLNINAKLTGVFIDMFILIGLSKFLTKSIRPVAWGIGLLVCTLLFLKIRMII